MITFYLSLFKDAQSMRSKFLSALLSGVNKALPYTSRIYLFYLENFIKKIEASIDNLFIVTHKGGFKASLQALSLLYEIGNVNGIIINII